MPIYILLDRDGDIAITESADIKVNYSIRQQVKILLLWFFEEWRFAPELGMPYFEEVFVKNPNTALIARIVRSEVLKADGVTEVRRVNVTADGKTRNAAIDFAFLTSEGEYREELSINV